MNKFVKILFIASGVIGLLFIATLVNLYQNDKAKFDYSLQKFDCSQESIKDRNSKLGGSEDACVIAISVHNLKQENDNLDFYGTFGPGFADWYGKPAIRIYDSSGKFCFGGVRDADENRSRQEFESEFSANETKILYVHCTLDDRHKEINDLSIDTHPAYLLVDYYGQNVRIDLKR